MEEQTDERGRITDKTLVKALAITFVMGTYLYIMLKILVLG